MKRLKLIPILLLILTGLFAPPAYSQNNKNEHHNLTMQDVRDFLKDVHCNIESNVFGNLDRNFIKSDIEEAATIDSFASEDQMHDLICSKFIFGSYNHELWPPWWNTIVNLLNKHKSVSLPANKTRDVFTFLKSLNCVYGTPSNGEEITDMLSETIIDSTIFELNAKLNGLKIGSSVSADISADVKLEMRKYFNTHRTLDSKVRIIQDIFIKEEIDAQIDSIEKHIQNPNISKYKKGNIQLVCGVAGILFTDFQSKIDIDFDMNKTLSEVLTVHAEANLALGDKEKLTADMTHSFSHQVTRVQNTVSKYSIGNNYFFPFKFKLCEMSTEEELAQFHSLTKGLPDSLLPKAPQLPEKDLTPKLQELDYQPFIIFSIVLILIVSGAIYWYSRRSD